MFVRGGINGLSSIFALALLETVLGASLNACSKQSSDGEKGNPKLRTLNSNRPDEPGLTHEEAAFRAGLVENLHYDVEFDFAHPGAEYRTRTVIDFDLKNPIPADQSLTLDSEGARFDGFTVNGKDFAPEDLQRKHFVILPSDALVVGKNEIVMTFAADFATTPEGIYKFIDPVDQKTYIYTDLEPYKANHVFPCFDQPDLKAKFLVSVVAPREWQVIANAPLERTDIPRDRHTPVRFFFKESLPISTYLFAVHAGNYQVWEDNSGPVPLRLFARQSLAPFVDSKTWLDISKAGLAYYADYFGSPYPFQKYDQIIIPDFLWGGMENVGAVTFSERFVSRGEKTESEKADLANVVLHEMAHMWFGDLVTMRWWNDLWLNESFASYMAVKASQAVTPYKNVWIDESMGERPWAYEADAFSTTHAISTPVANTQTALANFDGITYGKGNAALKQLNFLLGEDAFRAGVQSYFKKYAFSNSTLTDFLAELQAASGKDLSHWSSEWIESSGTNGVKVELTCDEQNKISALKLIQSGPTPGTGGVREHKTRVAFFDKLEGQSDTLSVSHVFDVDFRDDAQVSDAVGLACPVLIHPNFGDNDFFLAELDARTLAALPDQLAHVEDAQTRGLFWVNLWSMVEARKLSLEQYIEIVEKNLSAELDPHVAQNLGSSLTGLHRKSAMTFARRAPDELRARLGTILENFYWQRALASQTNPSDWKAWFTLFINAGESSDAFAKLMGIASRASGAQFQSLVDQDIRWTILQRLSAIGNDDAQVATLLESEKSMDASRRGLLAYEAATSLRPVLEIKQARLVKLRDDLTIDAGDLDGYTVLFPSNQAPLFAVVMEDAYQMFIASLKTRDDMFLEDLASVAIPMICTPEHLARAEKLIAENGRDMTPTTLKAVMENRDRLKTCANAKILKD